MRGTFKTGACDFVIALDLDTVGCFLVGSCVRSRLRLISDVCGKCVSGILISVRGVYGNAWIARDI